VNGPEDAPFDWRQVDWRRVEDEVRRLRQRIFTASQAGDLARVRQLQKLMLRSRANTLISVRRVTERNAGRLTAGVDGEVVLEAAFDAQRRFVANASHELRTPLAMMRTRLDVAVGKPDGVPPQPQALNAGLRRDLDRADALLESFLTLARATRHAHRPHDRLARPDPPCCQPAPPRDRRAHEGA